MEKSKIIVIDCKKNLRDIAQYFLSKEGYIVTVVGSGSEAIKLLKKESFNLVLCNGNLPGAYGSKVIAALIKLKKTPKIGIMKGWTGKLTSLEKGDLDIDFIARKPFKLSALLRQISEVIKQDNLYLQTHSI